MSALLFSVDGAEAIPFAAAPTMGFGVHVQNLERSRSIQSIALRAQIMIEAARRTYTPEEREGLQDLFGEPDRWSKTLRSFLWTHASVTVPSFTGSTSSQLLVPCTFDFNVGAAKYFYAVKEKDVPLCFQFSGTIFYSSAGGALQINQISWDNEAKFRLPANVWHDMMDHYYPDSAWLRLRRDSFHRLSEYKRRHGLLTWEEALDSLLAAEKEPVA
jgi:Family of unknown function (DUF6084)